MRRRDVVEVARPSACCMGKSWRGCRTQGGEQQQHTGDGGTGRFPPCAGFAQGRNEAAVRLPVEEWMARHPPSSVALKRLPLQVLSLLRQCWREEGITDMHASDDLAALALPGDTQGINEAGGDKEEVLGLCLRQQPRRRRGSSPRLAFTGWERLAWPRNIHQEARCHEEWRSISQDLATLPRREICSPGGLVLCWRA